MNSALAQTPSDDFWVGKLMHCVLHGVDIEQIGQLPVISTYIAGSFDARVRQGQGLEPKRTRVTRQGGWWVYKLLVELFMLAMRRLAGLPSRHCMKPFS